MLILVVVSSQVNISENVDLNQDYGPRCLKNLEEVMGLLNL